MIAPYRERPEFFHKAIEDLEFLPFDNFRTWLQVLNISESNAQSWFIKDYWNARTPYTTSWILGIFHEVAVTHKKKYDKLIAIYQAQYDPLSNYDRTEDITEIRTPDLTRTQAGEAETQTDASGSTDSTRNQTRTTTENGGNFQTVDTRAVQPFDASSFTDAEKNTQTMTGSRTTSEAYSGQPDHLESDTTTTTNATDSRTETETGTDTTTRAGRIYGNIGVTSSQDLALQEIGLADRMNIWKIIEKDLARALFIQTW